jgi:catechol-2,3-dioxygenase
MPRKTVTGEAVSPALFAHFVLRTSNFEAMRAWYLAVLNARAVHDNGTLRFLTYDDERHRVALVNVAELQKPAADSWGLNHVAYSYRTMRNLLSTFVRLRFTPAAPELAERLLQKTGGVQTFGGRQQQCE